MSLPLSTAVRLLFPLLLALSLTACDLLAGTPGSPPIGITPTPPRPGGATATATPGTGTTPVGNDNIKVMHPSPKQEVRSPLSVTGSARVFEANVQVALKDSKGQTLVSTFTTATRGAPDWGDYKVDLAFRVGAKQDGTLEVFTTSARDGTPQFLVSLPVVLLAN